MYTNLKKSLIKTIRILDLYCITPMTILIEILKPPNMITITPVTTTLNTNVVNKFIKLIHTNELS